MYKTHKIEGGYSVRHKLKNVDIEIFKGKNARDRARAYAKELNDRAKELENAK